MMSKIYISLPISGYEIEERRVFAQKREDALSQIAEVVNPLKNGLPEEAHWREHMRQDFKLLLDCDSIYMCEGWEASAGCKIEHNVATTCGINVLYETDNWSVDIKRRGDGQKQAED